MKKALARGAKHTKHIFIGLLGGFARFSHRPVCQIHSHFVFGIRAVRHVFDVHRIILNNNNNNLTEKFHICFNILLKILAKRDLLRIIVPIYCWLFHFFVVSLVVLILLAIRSIHSQSKKLNSRYIALMRSHIKRSLYVFAAHL